MSEYKCIVSDDILVKSHEERIQEWTYIINKIDVLMNNYETIVNIPEYFYAKVACSFIGSILTGTTVLYIGNLILLWEQYFIDECPECNGSVYIFNAGGSPLSGRHQYQGICSGCNNFIQGRKPTFIELFMPAYELAKNNKNFAIINKTVNHYFSPGGDKPDGIKDVIIRNKIMGIPIETLIQRLKNKHLS